MVDSDEISFQVVLTHCPCSTSNGLMFHAVISGNLQMAAILQGAAFNVTHFESRITHLLYTAINTTEHG
jgi:hypothetical protein